MARCGWAGFRRRVGGSAACVPPCPVVLPHALYDADSVDTGSRFGKNKYQVCYFLLGPAAALLLHRSGMQGSGSQAADEPSPASPAAPPTMPCAIECWEQIKMAARDKRLAVFTDYDGACTQRIPTARAPGPALHFFGPRAVASIPARARAGWDACSRGAPRAPRAAAPVPAGWSGLKYLKNLDARI